MSKVFKAQLFDHKRKELCNIYQHKVLDWLVESGYELDRNLLSLFSRTVLAWVVDFIIDGEPVEAIVCFDCVSTACQQWWWGLGRVAFIVATTDNLSSHSLAGVLNPGSVSTPAVTAAIVTLSRDARDSFVCADGWAECRQTENILLHYESENPMKNKGWSLGHNIFSSCSV